MSLAIGIDTGGTYTDAIIIDPSQPTSQAVLATAKALTTKGDLSIGVSEALRSVLKEYPVDDRVSLVTVSTTLATNAVVEGHGGRAALVLIGFDDAMAKRTGVAAAFPDAPIIRIGGGHTSSGLQAHALDLDALRAALDELAGSPLDGVAVSSLFAVRNPEHERRVAQFIRERTGLAVTESVDLSSSLDAPRRAATALLNARLVGRISALIDAVQRSLDECSLACPLMIVKGDGSRALASRVRQSPVETIMSGPAASTVGAAWLSGLRSFVMSDIGGTTTDTSVVFDGRPAVSHDGAALGGWRTMVPAIDVQTVGLGGDSRVSIAARSHRREINLGPDRVVPLSLLATVYPQVVTMLRGETADEPVPEDAARFLAIPFGTPSLGAEVLGLTDIEAKVMADIGNGVTRWRDVVTTARLAKSVERLCRIGVLVESGITPSDAAHVLGTQTTWSSEAARLGFELASAKLATASSMVVDPDRLAKEVWSATVGSSARAVLRAVLPGSVNTLVDAQLIEAVTTDGVSDLGLVRLSIGPSVPVVAVGGPAQVFYPEVGRRLNCDVVLPLHGEVANAVGAAVGVVSSTQVVTVTRGESHGFSVASPRTIETFASSEAAVRWAHNEAEALARADVDASGGDTYRCNVTELRTYLPGRTDDDALLSAQITAEALGTPVHR